MTDRHILGGQHRRPIRAACILPLLLSLVWPLVLALSPVNSHQVRVSQVLYLAPAPSDHYLPGYLLLGWHSSHISSEAPAAVFPHRLQRVSCTRGERELELELELEWLGVDSLKSPHFGPRSWGTVSRNGRHGACHCPRSAYHTRIPPLFL